MIEPDHLPLAPTTPDPAEALRPTLHAHVAAGTATQPQRYVLAEQSDQGAIATAWIACENPAEVQP